MDVRVEGAAPEEVSRLVEIVTGFYAEADFVLNEERAATAFGTLLAPDDLGEVWGRRCAAPGSRARQAAAQALYRAVGCAPTDRQLLTLELAVPTHAV